MRRSSRSRSSTPSWPIAPVTSSTSWSACAADGFCNGALAGIDSVTERVPGFTVGGLREVGDVRLVDASGTALRSAHPPRRIVSLIPSTTETLCALGLADALVGITVYCREPAEVTRTKTKIGGEKTPDLEAIRALGPDLVVANVEENVREHIEQLRAWAIPVW